MNKNSEFIFQICFFFIVPIELILVIMIGLASIVPANLKDIVMGAIPLSIVIYFILLIFGCALDRRCFG